MSAITRKPTAPPEVKPVIPVVVSPEAKATVVDTERQPRSTLVSYVEGAVYTVNYYSQVLGLDSALYAHDPNQSAVQQQFKKINRMEIRLTEPLSGQQDTKEKTFSLRGAGHITHGVIPNEGDMFTADVGDGRLGVFQINSTEKRSFFKDSVYLVEFMWLFFVESEPSRYADLENKVAATYHFVRDMAVWGQNPVVADQRYKSLLDLQELQHQLTEHYFQWFFSKEKGTILLPEQALSTYDAGVVKALHGIIDVDRYPQLVKVRQWSVEDDNLLAQPTLWDALLKRNRTLLSTANLKMGVVSTQEFTRYPQLRSIRYSGVENMIYPIKQNPSIDSTFNTFDKSAFEAAILNVQPLHGSLVNLDTTGEPPADLVGAPAIKNVLVDDFYVFSEKFYTNAAGQSVLEKLTWDFLEGEGINPAHLHYVARNYFAWGGLERFYYIPVVIILIQSLLRDTI